MNVPLFSTAASAWRHLVATAGLDADGYDEPLVWALQDPKGLALDASRDVAQEL